MNTQATGVNRPKSALSFDQAGKIDRGIHRIAIDIAELLTFIHDLSADHPDLNRVARRLSSASKHLEAAKDPARQLWIDRNGTAVKGGRS
ncbi:MAG: hypothetical protein PHE55_00240 [Methylococcaceae bacterium]|nr:hypothetical protein [Methylococcaceae bacterium]